jgi:hypothetical protein
LLEQGCEDPRDIFRIRKGSASRNVWETLFYGDCVPSETIKRT